MLSDLLYRLRALFQRRMLEDELDEELRFHFDHNVEKLQRSGLNEEEARRQAGLALGGVEQLKEECREARGVALVENLLQDFRYACRVLRQSPGFSLAVAFSLALGIGANTAIFTLLDAVMWRLLPVERPAELQLLTHGEGSSFEGGFTYGQFQSMRRQNRVLQELAGWSSARINISVDGGTEPALSGQLVSGNYFSVLGVRALAGRTIGREDDLVPNGHPVAMISHAYWSRRFGLAPAAIGRTVTLSGQSFTIIGVTPPEFFGLEVGSAPDIFVPMMMQPAVVPSSENLLVNPGQYLTWVQAFGRLNPGLRPAQAAAQLEAPFRQEIPKGGKFQSMENERLQLAPAAAGLSELRNQFSAPLFLLMGLVGIVLLIACANTANLLLARAAARQPEFAMRVALGAPRSRLISQLLVESVVLSSAGGALGLLLAGLATRLLVAYLSSGRAPIILDLNPNLRILAFTAAVSLLTGIVFGLVPALRATRVAAGPSLKNISGSTRGSFGSLWSGRVLAVVQVAMSLVLLVGAGLFVRSLQKVNSQDSGFARDSVLVVRVEPKGSNQRNADGALSRLDRTYRDLISRVEAMPGVKSVGMAQFTPTTPRGANAPFTLSSGEEVRAFVPLVYPHFFAASGISLAAGRDFAPGDLLESSPLVAVVNETFARRAFPNGNPVGQRIALGGEPREIIGVVKDSRYLNPRGDATPTVYQPFLQLHTGRGQMALYVRVQGGRSAVIPHVREAIQNVDRELPMFEIQTLAEEVDAVLVRERLMAMLSGLFSLLATLLAAVGLYGLFSFAVVQRTREIGIRMALGAQSSDVVWTVMREVLALAFLGAAIGIPVALLAARLASAQISGLLFGLRPSDPFTIATATLGLLWTAALAGFLPAIKAAQVSPLRALRSE
ncbi:ABC transporter permease [Paludibaculum fermentans]|uniref:ABC transporter permease n=1 Tax=Paludibaculum fermentans TaxID=1473598 RepID=A0A7S7NXD7_PALFE|nr:ABC transporter permease [Paludibaculum fermentans]QOY91543.1 ABC transporter permease [Paludibaculum fermentans]